MAETECCATCVYAWRDLRLGILGMRARMPAGPMCANQPGRFGIPTITPWGRVCCNYRPRGEGPDASAKSIRLTNGMIAYVDAADYEEISRHTWLLGGGGYAGRSEKRKWVFMHRQIMNPPEGMFVDHIHGNRLDNTRAHLRLCTLAENARNRMKRVNATSRYRGVSYSKNRRKWVVALPQEANQKFVGAFDDELDAARAYDRAAVLYLSDSARLNFPDEWPPERKAEVRAQRDVPAANPPSPEPQDKTPVQSDPAPVGANHDSPSPSPSKTEDRERKTEGPAQPRAAGRATRGEKKSRAKTQGREGRKDGARSKRVARRATKKDAT